MIIILCSRNRMELLIQCSVITLLHNKSWILTSDLTHLKLLQGWITHVWAWNCLLFSFSNAVRLPNSFIASLLSDAWKNEKSWFLSPCSSDERRSVENSEPNPISPKRLKKNHKGSIKLNTLSQAIGQGQPQNIRFMIQYKNAEGYTACLCYTAD